MKLRACLVNMFIASLLLILMTNCESTGSSNYNGISLATAAGLTPEQQWMAYNQGIAQAYGTYNPYFQSQQTNQHQQSIQNQQAGMIMFYEQGTGNWIRATPTGNGNFQTFNLKTGSLGQAVHTGNGNFNTYDFGTGTYGQVINLGNGSYYYYPFNYKK